MKNQPAQVAKRFAECVVGDVVMSAITFAELEYGVAVSENPKREHTNLAALVEDIHDDAVWLPRNSFGSQPLTDLNAVHGQLVTVVKA